MDNIEELAANVKAYQDTDIPNIWRKTRQILGYGVNELAVLLNVSGAQISRIEGGEREPTRDLIIKFAELKEYDMFNLNKKVSAMLRQARDGENVQHETFGKNKPNRLVTVGFENDEFWARLDGNDGLPTQEIKGEYGTVHSAIVGHLM